MKNEPEIVRILRQEEQLGKFHALFQGMFETTVQEPQKNVSKHSELPATKMINEEEKNGQNHDLDDLENRYNIIFENYAVAITLADEKERIISWNTYTEELFHMNEQDLFMRPITSLYPPEEWKKIRLENVRQKGIKYRMESKMLKKDGEVFDVEISLCVLRGAQGKNVGSVGIIKDITELKKAEKQLKESEARYRTIFENSAVAITLTDEHERIISWNRYAEQLLGMKKEDFYLKPVNSLYPAEEWQKIRAENVRKKGMQHHLETRIFKKNNELLDVALSLSVLKNHEGIIIGSIAIIKDITAQKKINDILEESERKFKQLYEKAPVPYHTLSPMGIITNVNEKWCQILGYTKEQVIGRPIFDFILEQDRKSAQSSFEKKMQGKKVYTGGHERKYITKDGFERVFVIHDFFSYDKNHKAVSIHTTMEDVTDRKQTENILKQSEEKYRAIFDLSPQSIVVLNKKGVVLDTNGRIESWLDYKREDIIGKNILELPFLPPKSKMISKKYFAQRMQGKENSGYELECLTKTGEKRTGLISATPIRDAHNIIIGDLVVISDVTKRQQEWEDMVKSEEKYRVLAETSADGVFTTDSLGRLTYVNPSLQKILGRRKSQILATLFRDYLSEGSVYLFQQIILDVRKQNKPLKNLDLEIVHSEGYEIPIEVNLAPLKKDGSFAGLEGTVRDITERKKMEREIKKSEQLKTEFMNIAAHELKSPVTPIKGYLELIISDKDTDEKIKGWAKISYRNAERLLNLVNDILDVSRLDTDTMRFTMEKLDPTELLKNAAEDMRLAAEKKNLKFIVDIPRTLPGTLGDFHRLSQVLKNLLTNAIKFTDMGSITIRAKKQGEFLQIAIEDTGIGISKDELKKIFTKFYQAYTGPDRKNEGAGLGLFICKEIVKKHKGDITVKSDSGKGSIFTVSLPILP